MAFKGLTRANISQATLAEVNENLHKQTVKRESSPLTESGKERGIGVFRVKDFENNKALVYIPNMPVMEVKGKRVKWHAPVFTHGLSQLGKAKDNYAGTLRSTLNFDSLFSEEVLAELGISGKAEVLQNYISKGWDYKNARDMLELAKLYKMSDPTELAEDKWKAIRKDNFAYLPISNATESFWFPIVVIDTVKDAKGINTMKPAAVPLLDDNGEQIVKDGKPKFTVSGTVMWYKASEKTFKDRFKKAVEPMALTEDQTYEGNLFLLDYTIREDEENKGKENTAVVSTLMQSANSLHISPIYNVGNTAQLYKAFEKHFAKWDEIAQRDYTAVDLGFDLVETQFVPDQAMEEELHRLYSGIEEATEQILKLRDVELAKASGAGATEVQASGIDAVLAGGGADEATKELPAGDSDDIDLDLEGDLDFDAE